MFFNKTNTQPAKNSQSPQAPRRSILNILFNPRIGDSIKPIGESFDVFVNLIAMVFAMNGLFPRNHPALQDQPNARLTPRLTMGEVFRTAWNGVEFTKDGIPKAVLFFAVAGMIVGTGIGLLLTILALFTGQAHAQSTYFTSPAPSTDIALNILNYLFGTGTTSGSAGANLASIYSANVKTAGMANAVGQSELQTMLGVYSNAMLIFAGIILFYHLAKMVVNTAHEGVVMGKNANQIWAPIRLVVAIILLVPVSGGLNTGQLIVIKMAQWGSNLASHAWNQFSSALYANATYSPPAGANVADAISDVALMSACTYTYNYYLSKAFEKFPSIPLAPQSVNGWVWSDSKPGAPTNIAVSAEGSKTYNFTPPASSSATRNVCGSYTIPAPPKSDPIVIALYDAQKAAFETAVANAMSYGVNVRNYIPQLTTSNLNHSGPTINDIIKTYEADLETKVTAAVAGSPSVKSFSNYGWVAAAASYIEFSAAQGKISQAGSSFQPTTIAPRETFIAASQSISGSTQLQARLQSSENWGARSDLAKSYADFSNFLALDFRSSPAGAASLSGKCSFLDAGKLIITNISSPTTAVFSAVECLAVRQGLWKKEANDKFSIGIRFTSSNPLIDMAAYGHKSVGTAFDLFDLAVGLHVASAVTGAVGDKVGIVAKFFGGTLNALATAGSWLAYVCAFFGGIFFAIGFIMGFLIPLAPFLKFFFVSISWLAVVFEAIVAVPLVALAHITPEGDGLPGQQARSAYYMVFSIFLRPILMLFGLVVGFMILYVAATVLNMLFETAVNASGVTDGVGNMVFLRIAYTAMYCVAMFSVTTHAFSLINGIPQRAMGWIGAQGAQTEKMGDYSTIEGRTALASAYFGQKGGDMIGNLAGKGLTGARQKLHNNRLSEIQAGKAADNQSNLISAIRGGSGGGGDLPPPPPGGGAMTGNLGGGGNPTPPVGGGGASFAPAGMQGGSAYAQPTYSNNAMQGMTSIPASAVGGVPSVQSSQSENPAVATAAAAMAQSAASTAQGASSEASKSAAFAEQITKAGSAPPPPSGGGGGDKA